MNTANTDITKFKIIVVEWLRDNDVKTGKELYDDILCPKEIQNENIKCEYHSVSTKKDFVKVFKLIEDNLQDGEIATLQIESHGSDEGIGVSPIEFVTWKEFYDLIRPINIKNGGLLFVCLSMCVSYASLSSIEPNKRAPYLAMIATTDKMLPDDLYNSFVDFYESYNYILDIAAFQKMANGVKRSDGKPAFVLYKAEDVFDWTFDIDRDSQNKKHLINECYIQGKMKNPNYTKEQAEKDLITIFEEAKSHRDYYCFKDIYGGSKEEQQKDNNEKYSNN